MYELLADTPSRTDRLGFEPMAETLKNVILRTPPPFTIGVFGEWGSGKSTLMGLVDQRLEAEKVRTVWFNAWKYDGKEVIWNALIQTIFFAMREEAKRTGDTDLWDRVGAAASNLAVFASKKLAPIISGGIVTADTIDQVTAALRPLTAADESFDFINTFEVTFSKLVEDYVGAEGRLVVFVDDLDRCLPENAVEVLEAIKLYLDRANVTFVIGIEPEVVRDGIRHRYRDNPTLQDKEYLEKIVQLPFVMRSLSREAAMSLITPFRKTEDYELDDTVVTLIMEGTLSNPRRIKRFINSFYVLAEMYRAQERMLDRDDARRLALVLLTQMALHRTFEDLVREPGLIGDFNETMRQPASEREKAIERSEALKRIFGDRRARKLFEIADADGLDCSRDVMAEWVLLTRGEGP